MSTIASIDGRTYTFTKGAPDFLIESCSSFIDANGNKQPLDDEFKLKIK